jgi:hypothetical protein
LIIAAPTPASTPRRTASFSLSLPASISWVFFFFFFFK